ncbi:MAG: type II secretion system F family protein [Verrucomicrobia bacterium]|nr:type II secretion system F family protein [Verrucomicrobiota bacterium]MCG2680771.1 type II secretion system F family protein [Kiritimatiellia bacterium]MBU4246909.1 type II secretion system F family protein [Verrucomicrobiota bacterium]MBU4291297.1 type II secretion system F family protein [Verrucomicrobiota bacterium]MBU4429946.1 type II secretion system F family protein [Verrucomicrobiota bacterium]
MAIFMLGLLWAVFAAGLTWYIIKTACEITYVTLADGRRQERRLPLLLGMLLPLTPYFIRWFTGPRFKRLRTNIGARLTSAGFDDVIAPEEFLALRVLCPIVISPALIIVLIGIFALSHGPLEDQTRSRLVFMALTIVLWMIMYPHFWLKQAIILRHKLIMRALPFVIDLLTLSVEAGLDFMTAIKNIINRRAPDPLGEELSRVLFEIQLGKTRREALKTMAGRVQQSDIRSLVTALVQADEMGVSIGAILRVQSDQIRTRRFMRAEKLANEAPVKMLFPLVACIFPGVFLILLGPIILQMLRQGM